jgi:integrase
MDMSTSRKPCGDLVPLLIFREAAFDRAAVAIRLPGSHPHELRHTAASLGIAASADVKIVQRMLRHKSAAMILDLYGHLFEYRLDEVAEPIGRRGPRG